MHYMKTFEKEVEKWANSRFGYISLENSALSVTEEFGEFVQAETENDIEEMEDAVCDIMVSLVCCCIALNINSYDLWSSKNEERKSLIYNRRFDDIFDYDLREAIIIVSRISRCAVKMAVAKSLYLKAIEPVDPLAMAADAEYTKNFNRIAENISRMFAWLNDNLPIEGKDMVSLLKQYWPKLRKRNIKYRNAR